MLSLAIVITFKGPVYKKIIDYCYHLVTVMEQAQTGRNIRRVLWYHNFVML